MTDHDVLFIAGLARSGTTALHRVLAQHPDIAVGLERYKKLWGTGIERITPAMFDRERYFDWSQDLTNITPDVDWARDRIAELERKWDTARYRGDKMTVIRAMKLWERIPEARFVFIVRDIAQVAYSWEQRAADVDDIAWATTRGALDVIEKWNTSIRRVHRAVKLRPEQAMVVEYGRFFGDPDAAGLRAATDFLDLDVAPVLHAFEASHQQYVGSVAGRDRSLPPELAEAVEAGVDRAAWDRVVALAP